METDYVTEFSNGNPDQWLLSVYFYFFDNQIPMAERMKHIVCCLTGEAEFWFRWRFSELPSWKEFEVALRERFGSSEGPSQEEMNAFEDWSNFGVIPNQCTNEEEEIISVSFENVIARETNDTIETKIAVEIRREEQEISTDVDLAPATIEEETDWAEGFSVTGKAGSLGLGQGLNELRVETQLVNMKELVGLEITISPKVFEPKFSKIELAITHVSTICRNLTIHRWFSTMAATWATDFICSTRELSSAERPQAKPPWKPTLYDQVLKFVNRIKSKFIIYEWTSINSRFEGIFCAYLDKSLSPGTHSIYGTKPGNFFSNFFSFITDFFITIETVLMPPLQATLCVLDCDGKSKLKFLKDENDDIKREDLSRPNIAENAESSQVYFGVKGMQILATFLESVLSISKSKYSNNLLEFVAIIASESNKALLWTLTLNVGLIVDKFPESKKAASFQSIVVENIVSLISSDDSAMLLSLKLQAAFEIGERETMKDFMLRVIQRVHEAIYTNFCDWEQQILKSGIHAKNLLSRIQEFSGSFEEFEKKKERVTVSVNIIVKELMGKIEAWLWFCKNLHAFKCQLWEYWLLKGCDKILEKRLGTSFIHSMKCMTLINKGDDAISSIGATTDYTYEERFLELINFFRLWTTMDNLRALEIIRIMAIGRYGVEARLLSFLNIEIRWLCGNHVKKRKVVVNTTDMRDTKPNRLENLRIAWWRLKKSYG